MKDRALRCFAVVCSFAWLAIAGYHAYAQTTSQPVTVEVSRANQSVVPSGWTIVHNPGVNTQATVTQASRQGMRHIATGIYAQLVAGTSAPSAVQLSVVVRDGASGSGTVLWSGVVALTAVAGASANPIQIPDLFIKGTAGNAMTLEFSAAGGANTFESVTLTGYDTTS